MPCYSAGYSRAQGVSITGKMTFDEGQQSAVDPEASLRTELTGAIASAQIDIAIAIAGLARIGADSSALTNQSQALQPVFSATRSFCQLIAMTGCRISEALATTPKHLDIDAKRVIYKTLKRRKTTYRAVPVPDALMRELVIIAANVGDDDRLWPWARQTGWRKIRAVMQSAGIVGPMAMPKGLRHAHGIRCAGEKIPPSLIQRWLGIADQATTAIYLDAVGKEEREFARRVW
jgi:integrase/recombinase XerD